jgi:D-xylose transport system permease protein
MATTDSDPLTAAGQATVASELRAEVALDLTAAHGSAAAEVPSAILAQSLGDYLRGSWQKVKGGDSGILPVLLGIVVVAIAFQFANGKFLSAQNLVNLFEQSSIYMLLAMAEIFALLLGEIDLSVGLVMGLGAVVVAELVQPGAPASCSLCTHGFALPWWVAIIVTLLVCAAVGLIQGTMVARFKMPSFIVTLGGLLVLQGAAIIVLHGGAVSIGNSVYNNQQVLYDLFWGKFSPTVSWILFAVVMVATAAYFLYRDSSRRRRGLVAPPLSLTVAKIVLIAAAGIVVIWLCNINRAHAGVIEGLPYLIPIVLVVLFGSTILLQRTRFGRCVYAIGGNPEAARRAGVSLAGIRTWCFVLAAVVSGVAGILFASWQVSVTTNIIKSANSYVLLAIAAAVIGGTSLFGGRGRTIHGILGGLMIGGIYNGLYLIGVASEWIEIVVALVLLAAGILDVLSRRGAQRRA